MQYQNQTLVPFRTRLVFWLLPCVNYPDGISSQMVLVSSSFIDQLHSLGKFSCAKVRSNFGRRRFNISGSGVKSLINHFVTSDIISWLQIKARFHYCNIRNASSSPCETRRCKFWPINCGVMRSTTNSAQPSRLVRPTVPPSFFLPRWRAGKKYCLVEIVAV